MKLQGFIRVDFEETYELLIRCAVFKTLEKTGEYKAADS
jgi:hypothetical protein